MFSCYYSICVLSAFIMLNNNKLCMLCVRFFYRDLDLYVSKYVCTVSYQYQIDPVWSCFGWFDFSYVTICLWHEPFIKVDYANRFLQRALSQKYTLIYIYRLKI